MIRLFSGFITFLGIGGLFTEPILGVAGILIGAFFWSSSYGIDIELKEKKFREYSSAYGLKSGKWKSLDKLPFITVMVVRESMAIHSRSNNSTITTDTKIGVYLLTNSHRGKILVQKFEKNQEAKKYAESLSKRMKKEIVQYSPVISEKTRARRRNK